MFPALKLPHSTEYSQSKLFVVCLLSNRRKNEEKIMGDELFKQKLVEITLINAVKALNLKYIYN